MGKKQEVAPVKENSVVERDAGAIPGIARIEDEGLLAELTGVEGAGASDRVEDRGVPLLYVAQKSSPQIDKKQDKYIKDLEAGDLFNNLTGEFFKAEGEDEGLEILPCFYRVGYVEWAPDRGGFVARHERDINISSMGGKMWINPNKKDAKPRGDMFELPNGNMLVETHEYYCVLPHNYSTIIVPMSSTNLAASRTLQAFIDARKAEVNGRFITLPAFWTRFKLQTVYRDEGDYNWYQLKPSVIGDNEDKRLREFCKSFALACKRNEVKASAPQDENARVVSDSIPV